MTRPKALLIVHQEHSDPARVGRIVADLGYDIDRRCPNLGDPLPVTMDEHEAVVIFGGPQSANDRDSKDAPGIRVELDFIPQVLDSGKPFLGICLGAQMLAHVLGGRVGPHPEGFIEAGYYEIEPTPEGAEYFDGSTMFYQWHKEGFELPSGATLLAQSALYANQAFRYGHNAYGLQFHPEVLEPIIKRWSERSAERLKTPGARPAETHLAEFQKYDPIVDRWIRQFIGKLFGAGIQAYAADAAD